MLKTILFTHDDMDGAGCRLVFSIINSKLNDGEWRVEICSNANIDEKVLNFLENDTDHDRRTLIKFADICASRNVIQRLLDEGFFVFGWDHHKTNTWVTDLVPNFIVTPESTLGRLESGTSLMYQDYANMIEEMSTIDHRLLDQLVDAIRSYDTYEWKQTKNIDAKKLNILFTMIGMDNFCNRYLSRIYTHQNTVVSTVEQPLITETDLEFVNCRFNNEQAIIDKFGVDDIIDLNIHGYKVAFLMGSVGANISELAWQFLEKHPEYDVFAQFGMYEGGSFSYRTQRSNIDVGKEFAIPLGGGGHPKAAGSHLPKFLQDAFKDALIRWMEGKDFSIQISERYANTEEANPV